MKNLFSIFFLLMLLSTSSLAQLDSIFNQNVWRTFIVHTPTGYSSANQYPIVLNLHGYNSDASQEQLYTQFDGVADTAGYIVVYPNGIGNSWSVSGLIDVDFLSHLVDTIRANYSCNSCLFVMGMSDGGFMTYKFATATTHVVTAIAVGSGNMSKALQDASALAPKLPVMHFHGTTDPLVNYNGVPPILPPIDTTIRWWVNHNNCNTNPVFTQIPDANTNDSSTVEEYYYNGGVGGSEVTFYKVINGGHTWSGAVPVPPLGNTNQDINQSALIGTFFSRFCSASNEIQGAEIENSIHVYPNPFTNQLSFSTSINDEFRLVLYDQLGQKVLEETFQRKTILENSEFQSGFYFYELESSGGIFFRGKLINVKGGL